MVAATDAPPSKTAVGLARESFWFIAHTAIAVLILIAVLIAFYLAHADPDSLNPKLLATVLTLFMPMLAGAVIVKARRDETASHVWIAGLLTFSVVCVRVLDMPTGPGLCENCGALEKLYRTFFDITHGSGLMGGDGLLVGTWLPLSMVGYAIGAKLGLRGRGRAT